MDVINKYHGSWIPVTQTSVNCTTCPLLSTATTIEPVTTTGDYDLSRDAPAPPGTFRPALYPLHRQGLPSSPQQSRTTAPILIPTAVTSVSVDHRRRRVVWHGRRERFWVQTLLRFPSLPPLDYRLTATSALNPKDAHHDKSTTQEGRSREHAFAVSSLSRGRRRGVAILSGLCTLVIGPWSAAARLPAIFIFAKLEKSSFLPLRESMRDFVQS